MQKLLKWLDDNLILVLAGFLLAFIPLYPKLPLFDILPGYIVRVRAEDFFVTFTLGLWIIWVARKKIRIESNLVLKLFFIYTIVVFFSMLSAMFIINTVPISIMHVGKLILHFLRRIEYFSLFVIFYTSIRSLRQVKFFLLLLIITMVGVTLYGYGQKYLYWPAFSTMNREFSKGWVLYLSSHARVLSTFGGHYDLAAFTMMLLIILWSLFLGLKNILIRLLLLVVIAGSFWLLILTASRTSFLAYIGGITILCFLWAFRRGLRWSLISWVTITLVSIVVMLSFGDLSERFTKLLKIDQRLGNIKSLLLNPFGGPPKNQYALYLDNNPGYAAVTSSSDQPPTPQRPVDVEKDIPLLIPISAGSATVSAVARTFSQNALVYDLSTGIRLDALWPKAIKGFVKNPLLGSGFSTLTKDQVTNFSEAESTDNDFLRSLGETGILGFLTFYAVLGALLIIIWRTFVAVDDPVLFSLTVGLGGIIFGLLLNAIYIDIFEASKVAFSFWAIAGITLGGLKVLKKDIDRYKSTPSIPDLRSFKLEVAGFFKKFLRGDLFVIIILVTLAFVLRLYRIDTPLADWHSWRQADTASVTRHFISEGVNILYPTYHDLSSVPSGQPNPRGLRLVEFPLYNVWSVLIDKIFIGKNMEFSMRLSTIFISLFSLIFIYLLVKKYEDKKTAILAALFFAILPYSMFYSRVILPEPLVVLLSLGFLYFIDKWLENTLKKRYYALGILFGAAAFLVKPYAFFVLPPILYLIYQKWGIRSILKPSLYLLLFMIAIPFVWWRWWINHFPEGIPAYTWLLNGDGIRFKGAFFYWLFADRLGRLILGYWGLPLFFGGILAKVKKGGYIFHFLLLGTLSYLTIIATGNVRHDYYQILVIPVVVIFLAKGVTFFLNIINLTFSKIVTVLLILITILGMEAFGWYHIKDYYNINHPEIVEAGIETERLSKYKSLVVAPYSGDTAFLYHTFRNGWPLMEGTIDDMIKKGAHYYVSINFDETTKDILKRTTYFDPRKGDFKLLKLTDKYAIVQLVPDKDLPQN